MSKTGNRTFSKRVVVLNCAAAWAVIGLSAWRGGDASIVDGAYLLIGTIVAGYMSIGHLDYRRVLDKEERPDDFPG